MSLRDDIGSNGKGDFYVKCFGWATSCTVSEYDSVGGDLPDGMQYDVLAQLSEEMDSICREETDSMSGDELDSMAPLCFDTMFFARKIKYDPNTNDIVGFTHNDFDPNVILKE